MPKTSHILNRGGRFYFRIRIPTDLARAGCYGKKKEFKQALGTSDPTKARSLALTKAVEIDEEFQQKRRELNRSQEFASSCVSNRCKFADLSEQERNDLVLRIFIKREKDAQETKRILDKNEREEVIANVIDDLGAAQNAAECDLPFTAPSYDSRGYLKGELEKRGIMVEDTLSPEFKDMAERLRRADVESLERTLSALEGEQFKEFDPLFKGYHSGSDKPEIELARKTVGDLCQAYKDHCRMRIEKGQMASSTFSKIEMRCRILSDFFGGDKALTAIGKDEAVQLVDRLSNEVARSRHWFPFPVPAGLAAPPVFLPLDAILKSELPHLLFRKQ